MLFLEWAAALTERLRTYIPEVRAVRRGTATATLRHHGRSVILTDDRGTYWVRFSDEAGATTMASLLDGERHDHFTAANFAKTIAGFFDGRFSMPE